MNTFKMQIIVEQSFIIYNQFSTNYSYVIFTNYLQFIIIKSGSDDIKLMNDI